MPDNVVYLHEQPRVIAQYMRVGFREHLQCEHLLSTNRLDVRRYVIEAANFERQAGLVQTLRDERSEIVLDTNAAELSVLGRYAGYAKAAPWAADGRLLETDDFMPGTNRSVIEPISRFAIEKKVSAVMAPTHYLGDNQAHWLSIDVKGCIALRKALDSLGGVHIGIDYPLILTYAQFRDPVFRQKIINQLKDAPFDYLWLRVSGFGADSTGSGIERYIKGLIEFHVLDRPIIADQVGGLTSLAVCAFGASSGFSHGIDGKERFSASGWISPKVSNGGFSNPKSIFIPSLDRRIKVADMRKLFGQSKTSRVIFGCQDHSCCGSIENMLGNPEAHFLTQKSRQVQALSEVPESLRTDQFLTKHVMPIRQMASRAMRLKNADDEIMEKIRKASKRLERVNEILMSLRERIGQINFAEEAQVRRSGGGQGAAGFKGNRNE